jgi:hypothetical protein
MTMATYVKYEPFIQKLVNGDLDLFGTEEQVNVVIHSDAPVVATDDELADLTQITGTGYTAGGQDTQNNSTRSGGTVTLTAVDVVWTGGAGGFTAGRYVSHYDSTVAGSPLICSHDYGGNFTVAAGETFTVDYGASLATFA